eukprot:TRINITY_DN22686_c0_g1_i1.p2 TRINITY_DN22686_c0_g1~~TRINITY_DN22686_c0_g1_i1.p2  ORF type:complete len:251 (+),score=-18.66 TRINITY_DN22686_c0_g1_i1:368-1120(+)
MKIYSQLISSVYATLEFKRSLNNNIQLFKILFSLKMIYKNSVLFDTKQYVLQTQLRKKVKFFLKLYVGNIYSPYPYLKPSYKLYPTFDSTTKQTYETYPYPLNYMYSRNEIISNTCTSDNYILHIVSKQKKQKQTMYRPLKITLLQQLKKNQKQQNFVYLKRNLQQPNLLLLGILNQFHPPKTQKQKLITTLHSFKYIIALRFITVTRCLAIQTYTFVYRFFTNSTVLKQQQRNYFHCQKNIIVFLSLVC